MHYHLELADCLLGWREHYRKLEGIPDHTLYIASGGTMINKVVVPGSCSIVQFFVGSSAMCSCSVIQCFPVWQFIVNLRF